MPLPQGEGENSDAGAGGSGMGGERGEGGEGGSFEIGALLLCGHIESRDTGAMENEVSPKKNAFNQHAGLFQEDPSIYIYI